MYYKPLYGEMLAKVRKWRYYLFKLSLHRHASPIPEGCKTLQTHFSYRRQCVSFSIKKRRIIGHLPLVTHICWVTKCRAKGREKRVISCHV